MTDNAPAPSDNPNAEPIQRWRIIVDEADNGMPVIEDGAYPYTTGGWVRYDDYVTRITALEAERDSLQAELDHHGLLTEARGGHFSSASNDWRPVNMTRREPQ